MRRFRWLHISDLDWAAQEWLYPDEYELRHLKPERLPASLRKLSQALHEDLARLHDRCGPWDLVILAGGLVDRSRLHHALDWRDVSDWVDDLWRHLDRLGSRPCLLALPSSDGAQDGAVLWKERNILPRAPVFHSRWGSWDFRARMSKDDLRIGIVGLAEMSDEALTAVLGSAPAAWAAQHDLRIVVTADIPQRSNDHPPDGYAKARFDLHLCGSAATIEPFWTPSGQRTIIIPGRAFGYLNHHHLPLDHHRGYIAGEYSESNQSAGIRLWLREPGERGLLFKEVCFQAADGSRYGIPIRLQEDEGTASIPLLQSSLRIQPDLPALAQSLGLEIRGEEEDGLLPVRLPELALALPQRETTLARFGSQQDEAAMQRLAERLDDPIAPGGPPPLVVCQGDKRPPLHGALILDDQDVARVRDARNRRRELARLLWQRASLERLSPYRSYGVISEPGMFYGRDQELQEIMATQRGHALLVVGPRRVGKSSLLNRAYGQLRADGRRAVYLVIRQTFTSPAELIEELIFKARLDCPTPVDSAQDYGRQAAALTRLIRQHLQGATLLFDEADVFLYRDRQNGGAVAEELRALVQEGTCGVVLAGYGPLYQATIAQSEVVYNLGKVLFLGPLATAPSLALATAPMERIGCGWADAALTEHVVSTVGAYPHLIQEACGRLLLRLRGERDARVNYEDVDEVLGRWKAETESSTLREMLIESIEVNLSGPAQAAVWLLAAEGERFGLADLSATLHQAGFSEVDDRQALDITHALRISGVCQRQGDRYAFVVPLLREAVRDLDIPYRLGLLAARWRMLGAEERARFDFWGGNGSRRY